ncbi:hypothetical protein FRC06_000912, partial [Ceratobasidium sp. 370]
MPVYRFIRTSSDRPTPLPKGHYFIPSALPPAYGVDARFDWSPGRASRVRSSAASLPTVLRHTQQRALSPVRDWIEESSKHKHTTLPDVISISSAGSEIAGELHRTPPSFALASSPTPAKRLFQEPLAASKQKAPPAMALPTPCEIPLPPSPPTRLRPQTQPDQATLSPIQESQPEAPFVTAPPASPAIIPVAVITGDAQSEASFMTASPFTPTAAHANGVCSQPSFSSTPVAAHAANRFESRTPATKCLFGSSGHEQVVEPTHKDTHTGVVAVVTEGREQRVGDGGRIDELESEDGNGGGSEVNESSRMQAGMVANTRGEQVYSSQSPFPPASANEWRGATQGLLLIRRRPNSTELVPPGKWSFSKDGSTRQPIVDREIGDVHFSPGFAGESGFHYW